MRVPRRLTDPAVHPLDQVEYEKRSSVISDPDGSVVFEMKGVEVAEDWSQLATDIVVSKYFRKAGVPETEHETSVRQVITRIAGSIREAGEKLGGYFDRPEDAETFEAELSALLVSQSGAFNSPVWFNCGLYQRYGIEGSGGNWCWNPETDAVERTANAYEHPQCSACFIQGLEDDLGSIFNLVKNEARVFKYGSGTGTNFSTLRAQHEKLSGGGTSSGVMSFLEVFDRAAGATKSGGTTRRAAKMVVLDMDHPEIEDFIRWKVQEEKKVQALIQAGYPADFNGEAYHTVSGQNSNNSVRVTDEFMRAVLSDGSWETRERTGGRVHRTYRARELMRQIAEAAWACADPGVQYDTTINDWHTCAETGRINASNPCSEFVFLDDTACNLASINLMKFLRDDGSFDIEGFRHASLIFILAQEILVDASSYPTKRIARNSHDYRPLGLGYANLGTLLMVKGLPYDSDEGRAIAAAISAVMTGHAYRTSALIAKQKGPFHGLGRNREPMMKVMRKHRDAAYTIDPSCCPADLLAAAHEEWDECLKLGEKHGYRNAQATVLAPTGTIGLLMDCDTTGIEPDFALVKFKKLAGGGHFKIVNASVSRALRTLGYGDAEIQDIVTYARGTQSLSGVPHINRDSLRERGLSPEEIDRIEVMLPAALNLAGAFNRRTLGDALLTRLGLKPETAPAGDHLLAALGFNSAQVGEANDVACGAMTMEGAPHLKDEHLPVFDCANRCGRRGTRFIAPVGHVRMMGAVQPFVSGAISKTVNLPHEATVQDVEDIYIEGWKLGLKAIALYRDGCKLSQPLNTVSEDESAVGELAKDAREEKTPVPVAATPVDVTSPPAHVLRGVRRRLPKKRRGFTQEARVGGQKIYIRTGEYEDKVLGEIFLDMAKEGAAYRSLMNCFAIAVSLGLQYGVPLDEYVDVFTFTRFEPHGPVTDHPNIKFATSLMDYVFRVLGYEYMGRTDFLQVKPVDTRAASSALPDRGEADNEAPPVSPALTTEEHDGEAPEPRQQTGGKGNGKTNGQDDLVSMVALLVGEQASGVAASSGVLRPSAGAVPASPSGLGAQMEGLMGDAPFCDICGHITVRNGACYKCLNCGNSIGCS